MLSEYIQCQLCSRTTNGTANRYPNASGTEQPAATHGTWNGQNWVGMIYIPRNLKGAKFSVISLILTANNAGTTDEKTVSIYSANAEHQSIPVSGQGGRGDTFLGYYLANVTGRFRNAVDMAVGVSDINAVGNYLSAGNQMLLLYDSSGNQSNYCRFTSVTLYIEYTDGSGSTVMYFTAQGVWQPCNLYFYDGSTWRRVNVNFYDGGGWRRCSH